MALLWTRMLLSQGVMMPVLLLLTVFFLTYRWLTQKKRDKSTEVPGPTVLPIIGNAYYLFTYKRTNTLKIFEGMCETFGSVYSIWIGPVQLIMAASATVAEKVLTTRSIRNRGPFFDKVGEELLLKGVLLASNERWRIHRKIVVSTLHNNVLQHYVKSYASRAMDVAHKLLAQADGTAVDIHMMFLQCIMNIICETLVGTKLSADLNNDVKFITAMLRLVQNMTEKAIKPWLMVEWIYKRSRVGKQIQKDLKQFHGKLRAVIAKKKQLLEESGLKTVDLEVSESVRRRDLSFIDLILMDGQMTEEDILGECASIVGAGSETVSLSCCYLLILLAEHPAVEEKIMLEQAQIFDSEDFQRPVTPEDLPRMTYLEQVIKETLRLHTPVPLAMRHVETDTDIGDGKIAAAGSYVLLFLRKLHRDARYFPDPMKFDPDRFAPENERNIPPYAYIPFGGGPRICLGIKLAMMQIKSIISTVLRHVKVTEAVTNMATLQENYFFGVVLQPSIPIRLRFSPRNIE